jgi:hypothetical protein
MARGDAIDDAAFDHLVGDLTLGPVGDGSSRLAGGLAGHGHDGADLLGGDLRWLARAWGIAETVLYTQFRERDRLEHLPTGAPVLHQLATDLKRPGDLGIAASLGGGQEDLGAESQLLRGGVPPDQGEKGVALLVGEFDGQGLRATHERLRGLRQDAATRQNGEDSIMPAQFRQAALVVCQISFGRQNPLNSKGSWAGMPVNQNLTDH